jgi:hypothetical protein
MGDKMGNTGVDKLKHKRTEGGHSIPNKNKDKLEILRWKRETASQTWQTHFQSIGNPKSTQIVFEKNVSIGKSSKSVPNVFAGLGLHKVLRNILRHNQSLRDHIDVGCMKQLFHLLSTA